MPFFYKMCLFSQGLSDLSSLEPSINYVLSKLAIFDPLPLCHLSYSVRSMYYIVFGTTPPLPRRHSLWTAPRIIYVFYSFLISLNYHKNIKVVYLSISLFLINTILTHRGHKMSLILINAFENPDHTQKS